MNETDLGIIAGKGAYPLELAVSARAQGIQRIVVFAFRGETDKRIIKLADEVHWLYVGELRPFLEAFRRSGVTQAVMAGQITPRNLFLVRIDSAMRALLSRLPQRNADTIFGAIGDELRQIGVELKPASLFMDACMPAPGVLTQRVPDAREMADIALGFDVAKTTSRLKIGQTVVIKEGTIISVEAFEGTNDTIRRSGRLAGPGAVVVKVAQPNHDMRWDIPVMGLRTLQVMRKVKASCLAIEAGRAILLERPQLAAAAEEAGIAIQAFGPDQVAAMTSTSDRG